MQTRKTIWSQSDEIDEAVSTKLAATLDKSEIFARLCLKKGLQTKKDVEEFITPDINGLKDPFSFFDMEKVVERIKSAIVNNEKITIYGDYDAGATRL